jgi:DNA segregation ATPase FtsK/SpoIIIE-like protein
VEPRETYIDDLFFSRLPDFVLHDVPENAPRQLIDEPAPPAPATDGPVPAAIGPGEALQAHFSRSEGTEVGGVGLDPLFHESVTAIMSRGRASAVVLQSQLGIGYSRANRILDQMTEVGLTGPETPTGARDIRLSEDALREFLEATNG